ncbi:MAG: DUF2637 domain-containing protein [Egibacteraceae bacterium]
MTGPARVLVLTVGVAAAVLSFQHITDLVIRAGVPVALAWLYAVMIDATIAAAFVRMAAAIRGSAQWTVSATLLGGAVGLSVAANVAAGIAGDLPWIIRFVVAGLPPLFLFTVAHQLLGANAAPTAGPVVTHLGTEPSAAAQGVDATPARLAGDPVGQLVAAYTDLGGEPDDPELTRAVTKALAVDLRTARRRLGPYRAGSPGLPAAGPAAGLPALDRQAAR